MPPMTTEDFNGYRPQAVDHVGLLVKLDRNKYGLMLWHEQPAKPNPKIFGWYIRSVDCNMMPAISKKGSFGELYSDEGMEVVGIASSLAIP